MNHPTASITRVRRLFRPTVYRVLVLDSATTYQFSTVQKAIDWTVKHLPGRTIQMNLA